MTTLAQETFPVSWDEVTRKVDVGSALTEAEIRQSITPDDWDYAKRLAKRFEGKRLIFINSTLYGGGVVIMRKPLIVLLRMLGVDADWYVLKPNTEAFRVTKWSFHNVLQAVPGAQPLTKEGQLVYHRWIDEEAKALRPTMEAADVVVIDDWQPSRLIRYAKEWGLGCRIILRDHIQTQGKLMVTPGTMQYDTWQFLWGDDENRICAADMFIAHPVAAFVPPNVPRERVALMPATVEPLDELLRPVTGEEVERETAWMNDQFMAHGSSRPLDRRRRYIILVARFDESKNMDGALNFYANARQRLINSGVSAWEVPQLVLVGNGATDDPSGEKCLQVILELRRTKYSEIQDDIFVARVPHRDLAINVLLRGAWLAVQPSIAEGFESRVTDAIMSGVPVIGSTEGGIPLQILEGKSGFIRDPRDYDAWAEIIVDLFTDEDMYQRLRTSTQVAARIHNIRFTTIRNLRSWLTLAIIALEEPDRDLGMKWADELALAN